MQKVYQTLHEMMFDREYIVNKDDLNIKNNISTKDFDIIFNHKFKNLQTKVFYIDQGKIGINNIKSIIDDLNSILLKKCLIIHKNTITSFAKQYMDTSEYFFECFSENDLLKNVTKHFLVPKHTLLSDFEKRTLLRTLKCSKLNLPKIFKNDPISKYYGANSSDVFKIIRVDNNIESIYYRICI